MYNSLILNNRYQLLERQATGGMAEVYRAHDLMLERTVAIKILRKDFSNDPEFRQRFRQEAKAAANLTHPNIVTIHDFGLDAGVLFIVMEYVPGTDVKTMLRQRGKLEAEALPLIIQACAGIGYAHRAGLVHCDIKPQNMLVTPDQQLKVVDFGIARALAGTSPLDKTPIVWGSPLYFSPEQASGAAPTPASDVYSLGVVLFEMLTGQPPFMASSVDELARLHRVLPPPSPRRLNPGISSAIESVILKALSKDPSSRYQTADLMGRTLAGLAQAAGPFNMPFPVEVPSNPSSAVTVPTMISSGGAPIKPHQITPRPEPEPSNYSLTIDWITWILILLAIITVGGLIPFWLWVYYTLNPPF